MRLKIFGQDFADKFLSAAGRRAVIVGEVKVGDAEVESPMQHLPGFCGVGLAAEIMPAAE